MANLNSLLIAATMLLFGCGTAGQLTDDDISRIVKDRLELMMGGIIVLSDGTCPSSFTTLGGDDIAKNNFHSRYLFIDQSVNTSPVLRDPASGTVSEKAFMDAFAHGSSESTEGSPLQDGGRRIKTHNVPAAGFRLCKLSVTGFGSD